MNSIIPFRLNTNKNSFYLYEIKQDTTSYCGFLGIIPINCIESGKVKGHENILNKRRNEIFQQIKESSLQNEPILIMYEESPKLSELMSYIKTTSKQIEIHKNGVTSHTIWQISALDTIKNIIEEFSSIPNFTIADGHHRTCAVRSIYRDDKSLDKNYFGVLAFMLSQNQVKVSSMNRILKINVAHDDLASLLSNYFHNTICEKAISPRNNKEIGLFYNGLWHKLIYKFDEYISYSVLENILKEKFHNICIEERSFYGNNIKDFETEVGDLIGITFYAPTAYEIMDIANKQKKLPHKSTWIEPKIPSGIITYSSECSL